MFHDKTKYDEKVTTMISDYVNIISELIDMVRTKDKNITKDSIYSKLEQQLRDRLVSNREMESPEILKISLRVDLPLIRYRELFMEMVKR